MFSSLFQWKINLRERLDLTKASMSDTCAGLGKLSENNVFISEIFTGYNILIQHAEIKRRGIEPVMDSLSYLDPKRQFLINTIKDDLQSSTSAIIKLFSYGSHDDLRPDEMDYIKYLDPRDCCNCGECTSSVRVLLPDRVINVIGFNPPVPQEPVQDSPISITNRGDIRIRVAQREPASRSIMVPSEGQLLLDIPSSTRFSNFLSRNEGRVTISIDMRFLRNLIADINIDAYDENNDSDYNENDDENESENENDEYEDVADMGIYLENVSVLLGSRCFNSVVDIATETDLLNAERCAICLDKIETNSKTLEMLGVKLKCCGKIFHDSCVRHMTCDVGPPKCPLCRKDLRSLCTHQECNHNEFDLDF